MTTISLARARISLRALILCAMTCLSFFVAHAEGVSTSRTAGAIDIRIEDTKPEKQVSASLKEGFHFNLQAPNQISGIGEKPIPPTEKSERSLRIVLPANASIDRAVAMLYVCDDANTYCDINRIALKDVSTGKAGSGAAAGDAVSESANVNKLAKEFSSLLVRAKKEKKAILLDFSARWCPGCRRLHAEVLESREFKNAAKGVLRLEVDVDLYEAFELSKKYDIYGIPTLLLIDGDGEEVARLVDYQPTDKVTAFLKDAKIHPANLKKLQADVAGGSVKEKGAASRILALRLVAANRFAEALPLLEKIQPPPPQLLQARVGAALKDHEVQGNDETKSRLRDVLRAAIKAESESLRSIVWRQTLLGVLEKSADERSEIVKSARDLKGKLLTEVDALKRAVAFESVGEFTGYERFLTAVTWAELLSESGASDAEQKAAWVEAAETGRSSGITDRQSGPGLRYLIVLMGAGQFAEADQWVLRLIAREPENKDLLRRRLRILVELKKFDEAVRVGEESRKFAEGRMEFSVIELLVKAYIGANKKDVAKTLLAEAEARPELQHEKMKSWKEKLKTLRLAL